jgi:hypothetical protein
VEALRARATGPRHEVHFPVLYREGEHEQGGLVRACLTRLAVADGPRLVLAPWSPYLLRSGDAIDLDGQLDDLLRRYPSELGDGRFLLELLPLESAGPRPPGLAVEGRSLGLAVLLAAWAAHTQPSLLPLVATGRLQGGAIVRVEGVAAKARAVAALRRTPGQPAYRFLVPEANRDDVPLDCRDADLVRWVPAAVPELFGADDLLADGGDGYRRHWRATAPDEASDEGAWLLAAARDSSDESVPVLPLPFGDEPALAAQALLRVLGGEGPAVALPLPLHVEAEGAAGERLARLVEAGLGEVARTGLIAAGALRNLLGTFGDRVLLVCYGRPSPKLASHQDDQRRLHGLLAERDRLERRPRLLVLASDLHHARSLCAAGLGLRCVERKSRGG